jgi:hypothetical protein
MTVAKFLIAELSNSLIGKFQITLFSIEFA